ncbi:MAG: hypothetical protein F6J93_06640 [Oscillatoria sp. SIO1A7]|nr:hypothetical protein [Oscillatoria sp. SIO1A7]
MRNAISAANLIPCQSYPLPILSAANLIPCQSYPLPILSPANLIRCQSYPLPILSPANLIRAPPSATQSPIPLFPIPGNLFAWDPLIAIEAVILGYRTMQKLRGAQKAQKIFPSSVDIRGKRC